MWAKTPAGGSRRKHDSTTHDRTAKTIESTGKHTQTNHAATLHTQPATPPHTNVDQAHQPQ
eukprot:8180361-Prorocentrum_lima.AAC.1